jgi:hypothetical protein
MAGPSSEDHLELSGRDLEPKLKLGVGVGLTDLVMPTYVIQRQVPLPDAARESVQPVVVDRNWGERIRNLLDQDGWRQRSVRCEADSASSMLARPHYYCPYLFTVFTGRRLE